MRYFSAVGEHVDEHVLRDAVEQVVPAQGDEVMATLAEKWIEDGVSKEFRRECSTACSRGRSQPHGSFSWLS